MRVLAAISLLFLVVLSLATPTPLGTSIQSSDDHCRGVAFNDKRFPHLFNGPKNKIGWMYNWASNLCGSADKDAGFGAEYVPMLHSDREDNTGIWYVS
jgi:hypothetical protein